ncbi:hypothetical protein HKT22_36775, partial [Pseudomonas aeruginosa]|nr:hypothetical protein [Pseudomonas aeruginosa]
MRALLVAACLLLGGCSHFAEDDWLGEDKALHFASSAALAAAGMQMAHDRGRDQVFEDFLVFLHQAVV